VACFRSPDTFLDVRTHLGSSIRRSYSARADFSHKAARERSIFAHKAATAITLRNVADRRSATLDCCAALLWLRRFFFHRALSVCVPCVLSASVVVSRPSPPLELTRHLSTGIVDALAYSARRCAEFRICRKYRGAVVITAPHAGRDVFRMKKKKKKFNVHRKTNNTNSDVTTSIQKSYTGLPE